MLLHCVLLVLLLQREQGKDYGTVIRAFPQSTALKERLNCCRHTTKKKKLLGDCCELYNNTIPDTSP